MTITSLLRIKLLINESRVSRGFKKASLFAICALVWKACWVQIGQDILPTFIIVSKAYVMSIGATKVKRNWWTSFKWWTIFSCWTTRAWAIQYNQVSISNHKNIDPSSYKINWRILCALNVRNTSANEISLNWKMSKQQVSNSLGYVLVVRTGCEREISSPH